MMRTTLALSFVLATTAACTNEMEQDLGSVQEETAPSGASGVILGKTSVTNVEFDIKWEGYEYKIEADGKDGENVWMTNQQVDLAAGGHTGWHTHAGPTIVLVTQGPVSVYHPEDLADCSPRVFESGSSFIDGPDFGQHIAKNESDHPISVKILHLLPLATTPLRIDIPAPAGASNCGL